MAAPRPLDESARLATLIGCSILDTEPDPRLDDLVRLAASIFGTPIALISLIDKERQWFKSRIGLSMKETPRDIAFCAYTILSDQLFIVPDTLADERFAMNPLVTAEPFIRFYAAAPLFIEGHAIGALCVIDVVPRQIEPRQSEALRVLASQVVTHLELHVTRLNEARLRQEAELQRLRQSLGDQERLLRAIIDGVADGVVAADRSGRLLLVNEPIRALFAPRLPPDQVVDWAERLGLRLPDGTTLLARDLPLVRALEGDQVVRFEMHRGDRDHPCVMIGRARPLRDERGALSGAVMTILEVTKERDEERARFENEERLRTLLDQLPATVWTADAALKITSVRGPSADHLPWRTGDLIDRGDARPREAATAQIVAAHRAALQAEASSFGLTRQERSYECYVNPLRGPRGDVIGAIGVSVDVTELKRLQGQLNQAQKLESVGRLAGGIAHDFNNLLTVILASVDIARDEAADGASVHERLDGIRLAAERAADLTRQLLAFSVQQPIELQAVDLTATVTGLLPMLRRLLGEDVRIETALRDRVPAVRGDPAQLESVILNLAANARDAMPRGGPLRIAVDLADQPRADALPSRVGGDEPQSWVHLAVADTGAGMDAETLARAFDPFFTTKEPGRGTGLGLAMVYGIVCQSGGSVAIDSRPGRGTTVHAWFPVVPLAPTATAAIGHERRASLPHHARVLIVEDDDQLRSLAAQVLGKNGYSVTAARDADAALQLADGLRVPIDLLLTDIVMPGMNGLDLARRLLQRWPGLRTLFMSGYADPAISRYGQLPEGTLVAKPYTMETLLTRIDEALAAGRR